MQVIGGIAFLQDQNPNKCVVVTIKFGWKDVSSFPETVQHSTNLYNRAIFLLPILHEARKKIVLLLIKSQRCYVILRNPLASQSAGNYHFLHRLLITHLHRFKVKRRVIA